MPDVHVVVLAAGKGTRMKSARPKVLHRVGGASLIEHVLSCARTLVPASLTIVVGHQADDVRAALAPQSDIAYVVQEPQLGTAHAVLMTEPRLSRCTGTLVLLSGDVPLLRPDTLRSLVATHRSATAAATVVTATVRAPGGYGRIVRDGGRIARIVEERDATDAERAITEINAGIYAFELEGLFESIRGIAAENAQREYYLPDLIAIFRRAGRTVTTVTLEDAREVLGVNTRAELAAINALMKMTKNDELMAAGVTISDPATTYVDRDVTVGADTVLHPGVSLERGTSIGSGCEIHSGVRLVNATIEDGVTILNHCLIVDSTIHRQASVGPFAHLRGHAVIGARARIGNFVEVKKSTLGPDAKAGHLAYLGDAVIGAKVNIGAGTITCNYDGEHKHVTTIGDGAFIGSDTQLIAPVTVGDGAYVGTGTTVRENVPPGALAVSAGKQRNIEGWVERKRKTRQAK